MGRTILSILFFALQVLAQTGAVVTETMRIEIDNRIHIARKINGRWWSEDNRELSQTNVGWLWNISGGNARSLMESPCLRTFRILLSASKESQPRNRSRNRRRNGRNDRSRIRKRNSGTSSGRRWPSAVLREIQLPRGEVVGGAHSKVNCLPPSEVHHWWGGKASKKGPSRLR